MALWATALSKVDITTVDADDGSTGRLVVAIGRYFSATAWHNAATFISFLRKIRRNQSLKTALTAF